MLGSSQSQRGSLPVNTPPDFEHLPSAARQLQIIALSSGRQSQSGQNPHPLQSLSHITESPEPPCQKKKTSGGDDGLHLPPELPKNASPIPSPPSLLSPASPLNQTGPQTQTTILKCDVQEQQEKVPGTSASIGGQGSTEKDKKVEKDDAGEQGNDEASAQKEEAHGECVTEWKDGEVSEEEHMKVTEGESIAESSRVQRGEDEETAMDQSDSPTSQTPQKSQISVSVATPEAATDSSREPKPILGQAASGPGLGPEVPLHPQRPGSQLDQPVSQEDCENMSTQSDNHSGNLIHYYFVIFLVSRVAHKPDPPARCSLLLPALSSLSSQSPPASPSLTPSAENVPPLLPAHTPNPTDLSLSQRDDAQKVHNPPLGDPQHFPETEPLSQSEQEPESFGKLSGPWEPKAWPEGRQVLTHLVDGFVIQEGLQPFPVRTRLF